MSKSKSRTAPSSSFLPEPLKRFFARRFFDGVALGLMAFAAFWIISIISYSPADLSANAVASTDATIDNWGGTRGAYLADIIVQSLGYAGALIGLVFGVWAVRLLRRGQAALPLSVRLSCLLIGVLCIALATAALPKIDGQVLYWGGAVGHSLMSNIISLLPPALDGTAKFTLAALSAAASLVCMAVSLGFQRSFWMEHAARIWALSKWLALYTAYKMQAFYGWLRHYDELDWDKPAPQKPEKPARQRTTPSISAEPAPQSTRLAAPSNDYTPATAEIVAPAASASGSKKSGSQKRISFDSLSEWEFPPSDILQEARPEDLELRLDEKALQRNADMLQQVLTDFGVDGEIVKIRPGPVVTLYELEPAPGVKSSKVIGLSDDIARSMAALSVRAAVVPGRSVIGIEIPNQKRQIVYLRSLIESTEYVKTKAALPLILGKDIGGESVIADLSKMPHLLIAGTTGSGKSVAVNTMILSLLYRLSPEQCRMIMIDPKMLELSIYDNIPHLLSPVVTDPGRAVVALKWAVQEMENRYRAMSKFGVRNIDGYNAKIRQALAKGENLTRKVQTGYDPESGKPVFEDEHIELVELPYIVIIVDEFADLMLVAGKDVEGAIQRLAQMARAAGIHLIMATQRPSVDVITGVIKANFPTRISFQVTSKFDSRTILGDGGAEQLLGRGDMLYMASGGRIQRVHGPFVDDKEVEEVVSFVKEQGEPDYLDDVTDGEGNGLPGLFDGVDGSGGGSDVDDMYDQAVALVAREGKASTSFIQRHLQIGYNRAARIIEEMEKQGVVGPANHVGKREILISDHSGGQNSAAG